MDRAGSILARWVLMLLCAPALTAGFVTTPLGGVYRGKLFVGSERLLLACRLARCCCKIHSLTYAVWVLSSMISLRCVEHHRVGGWLVGWVDMCMAARHHLTSIGPCHNFQTSCGLRFTLVWVAERSVCRVRGLCCAPRSTMMISSTSPKCTHFLLQT